MGEGGCAKCLLICVNLVITLIGCGFFVTGVVLRFAANAVDGYIDLEKLADRIPDFAESVGLMDPASDDVKNKVSDYTGFEIIGLILLILGLFIMITGFLGMCGACCTNKCMLLTYIIIVVIGVLAQLAIVVAFATDTYVEETEKYLKKSLKDDYEGIDNYDLTNILWNYMMLGYGCCGLDDGSDFEKANKWMSSRQFIIDGQNVTWDLAYPIACCKTKGSFPGKLTAKNETCAINPTPENNNFDKGCWKELKKDIEDDMVTSAATVGVLLLVQIICAILAICVLAKNRKDKSDQYA